MSENSFRYVFWGLLWYIYEIRCIFLSLKCFNIFMTYFESCWWHILQCCVEGIWMKYELFSCLFLVLCVLIRCTWVDWWWCHWLCIDIRCEMWVQKRLSYIVVLDLPWQRPVVVEMLVTSLNYANFLWGHLYHFSSTFPWPALIFGPASRIWCAFTQPVSVMRLVNHRTDLYISRSL